MASFEQLGNPDSNILWDAIYGKGTMKKDKEGKKMKDPIKGEIKKADKYEKKMEKKGKK
jgi:hypothetical protein